MPRKSLTERIVGILPLREGASNRDFYKHPVFSVARIWVLMNVPGSFPDFTRSGCCFCVVPALDKLVTFREVCLLGNKAKATCSTELVPRIFIQDSWEFLFFTKSLLVLSVCHKISTFCKMSYKICYGECCTLRFILKFCS